MAQDKWNALNVAKPPKPTTKKMPSIHIFATRHNTAQGKWNADNLAFVPVRPKPTGVKNDNCGGGHVEKKRLHNANNLIHVMTMKQ